MFSKLRRQVVKIMGWSRIDDMVLDVAGLHYRGYTLTMEVLLKTFSDMDDVTAPTMTREEWSKVIRRSVRAQGGGHERHGE